MGGPRGIGRRRSVEGLAIRLGLAVVVTLAAGAASRGLDSAPERKVVKAARADAAVQAPLRRASATRSSRWSAYIASERQCPGGDRADLVPDRQRATLTCLVNWARARRGLAPLGMVRSLNAASLRKAADIVRCQNFAHSPCGGDWRQNVVAVGYAAASGENLYLGEGRLGAPRVALDGWLNSPTHRRNLFDPRWTSQGIALLIATAVGDYRNAAIWVHVLGAA